MAKRWNIGVLYSRSWLRDGVAAAPIGTLSAVEGIGSVRRVVGRFDFGHLVAVSHYVRAALDGEVYEYCERWITVFGGKDTDTCIMLS